ncbi:uncharacterized protein (TIGR01370 family) [Roseiarcus fermentans]|uniref:Uncharacterized protein (TIGR01370 family) n=1 Tax=Roseiarcus fermentans TaxID=1473586 RepID=A0A366FMK1_9HYPH|nr:endo alpha-1,4 polygalactosaminidase [Roseiarcus fermentans]RBP15801.1 uncharacterized protein (TIGR01370 family) [Roseiarcus fermentans]
MSTPVNGVVVYNDIDPAQVASAPVGVKLIDIYGGANGGLFTNAQVAQMESGGGSLLGYFSIGMAESYRPYFSSLPSSALGPQVTSGVYQAAYWTPAWLSVAETYVQTMIDGGYQGAFFDVVNQAETAWSIQNAPGGTLASAEGAMITLIQEVANYAHSKDPNFQIWINSSGAYDMLANSTLVNTISGAIEESLYYQSPTTAQPADGTSEVAGYLKNVTAAGKPVIDIEFVSGAAQVADVVAKDKAAGFGYYIANPDQAFDGIDTQGFSSSPPAGTVPTVAIVTKGVTTTSAAQTIAGTVDVADAGSTVTILDGTKSIGSATVAANGAWSAAVTLANAGANVLTATDANSAGKGTSNAVTFTLQSATTPAAPTLSIAKSPLTVSGGGGKVALGVHVTAPASATATTVTIAGLPRYETITDSLDGARFSGSSLTLTAAEVDSGLTLTSHYRGGGTPSATLTITATDTIGGVSYTSAAKTLVVNNPPPASTPGAVGLAKTLAAIAPVDEAASISIAPRGSGAGSVASDLASALASHGGAVFDPTRLAPVGDLRLGTLAAADPHRV